MAVCNSLTQHYKVVIDDGANVKKPWALELSQSCGGVIGAATGNLYFGPTNHASLKFSRSVCGITASAVSDCKGSLNLGLQARPTPSVSLSASSARKLRKLTEINSVTLKADYKTPCLTIDSQLAVPGYAWSAGLLAERPVADWKLALATDVHGSMLHSAALSAVGARVSTQVEKAEVQASVLLSGCANYSVSRATLGASYAKAGTAYAATFTHHMDGAPLQWAVGMSRALPENVVSKASFNSAHQLNFTLQKQLSAAATVVASIQIDTKEESKAESRLFGLKLKYNF